MNDSSRSVPPASRLLAESVLAYRRGFPGVIRAFLPVFAIFAFGQIGLSLWGEAETFPGLIARALALAAIALLEVTAQVLATAGVAASAGDLPQATVRSIYRRGAAVFWPVVWSALLVLAALSAPTILAGLAIPYVIRSVGAVAALAFGASLDGALLAAVAASAAVVIAAAAASLFLVSKFSLAFPLVASGARRGIGALEESAGLSEGRFWSVGAKLSAGIGAVAAALLPFLALLVATSGPFALSGALWAWSLFAAAYLLVAVPFGAIFLSSLAANLRDSPAERALAGKARPWASWAVRSAVAVWALLALKVIFT